MERLSRRVWKRNDCVMDDSSFCHFDSTAILALQQRMVAQTSASQGINERHVAAVKALAQLQGGYKALQDQSKIRQEAFSQLQQTFTELQHKHTQVVQTATTLQTRLDEANRELMQLREKCRELSSKLSAKQLEAENLQQANESLQQKVSRCMLDLDDLHLEARNARGRFELVSHSTGRLEASISHLQNEVQEKVGIMLNTADHAG